MLMNDPGPLIGQVVKLTGTLNTELKCGNVACPESDPCCNACRGHYVLELRDPAAPKSVLRVNLDKEGMSCAGTTCGASCSPFAVGETYTTWGVLTSCMGQSHCTLLHMGGCVL